MSNIPRPVFIGYDPREHEAYQAASCSILRRSRNVLVTPLYLLHLEKYINRPVERRGHQLWCPISEAPMSTEFAISRFAVPHLHREGWSLFVDSDIVCLADVNDLFDLADDRFAVMVVKRADSEQGGLKMDGQQQTSYPRKNWSSVVLWNGKHPGNRRLTVDVLHDWPGRDLHAFRWLEDDEIGGLPAEWNYPVGVDPEDNARRAKIMHFTLGGPFLEGWPGGPFDGTWRNERMLCPFY